MRPTVCVILLAAAAGCSPVAPWPSFYPAEYSEDQIHEIPRDKVPLVCRACPADRPAAEVCAALYPLEKPPYAGGRVPDGRPGLLVPVALEYRNVGEERAYLAIRKAEIVVDGVSTASHALYSDFGWDDYVSPADSRSLTVGFVVAEEAIRGAESFTVTCPCPGGSAERLEFEFVRRPAPPPRSASSRRPTGSNAPTGGA